MQRNSQFAAIYIVWPSLALLGGSGLAAVADTIAPAPSFTITALTGPKWQNFVDFQAVNDDGETVGMCRTDRSTGNATDWPSAGGLGNLLDSGTSVASGINKIGVIVGRVGTQAVAWRKGVKKPLAMPSSVSYSSAMSINNHGEIVGSAIRKDISTAFLRLTDASVVFLAPLPNLPLSHAYSINDHGDIAGASFSQDGASLACVWRDRRPVSLGTLGGPHSEAHQINGKGDVVGDADLATGKSHACLWHEGKAIDLGTLPGDDTSRAVAINDNGDIVGVSGFKSAFLWKNGQMYKLQDVITPAPTDWNTAQATAINAKGQIAGWGSNENGHVYGFLLTPK